jgi:curli biogenesis system outer membrane secretion channel CsgG
MKTGEMKMRKMKIWKVFLAIAVAFWFCPAAYESAGAAELEMVRLGVMGFASKTEGVSSQQAEAITDIFTRVLANSKTIIILEREQIATIGSEHRLSESGLTDMSMAIQVGKIAGCQYMLLGSVTELSEKKSGGAIPLFGLGASIGVSNHEAKATLDARIIDVTTSEVILALSESGTSSESATAIAAQGFVGGAAEFGGLQARAIAAATTRLAHKIREELGGEYSYVLSVGGKDVNINIGSASGVKGGDLYLVYGDGIEVHDIDGSSLGKEKHSFAVLKVRNVNSGYSVCDVAPGSGSVRLIQRGDKIEPISKERAKELATRKGFVSERPRQRTYDDTWAQLSGNAPAPTESAPLDSQAPQQASRPLPQPASQPQKASSPLPHQSGRPAENASTDPAKVIATYSLSSGEANTRRIAHLSARTLKPQNAYDKYVDLANSFGGDYLAAYQAGEAARKLKKNDNAKMWYDKALAINPNYKPAQDARKKMK